MDLKHAADLGPLGGTEVLACTGLGSDCVQIDTAMLVVGIKLQVRCYKVNEQEKQGPYMQQASPRASYNPSMQCNCPHIHTNFLVTKSFSVTWVNMARLERRAKKKFIL
jgi:hypothetical protein